MKFLREISICEWRGTEFATPECDFWGDIDYFKQVTFKKTEDSRRAFYPPTPTPLAA